MKQFSNLDHIKYLDLSVYIRKSGSFIEPLKLMVTILSYLNPVTTLDIYLEKMLILFWTMSNRIQMVQLKSHS